VQLLLMAQQQVSASEAAGTLWALEGLFFGM
jgi:hypothetical protein